MAKRKKTTSKKKSSRKKTRTTTRKRSAAARGGKTAKKKSKKKATAAKKKTRKKPAGKKTKSTRKKAKTTASKKKTARASAARKTSKKKTKKTTKKKVPAKRGAAATKKAAGSSRAAAGKGRAGKGPTKKTTAKTRKKSLGQGAKASGSRSVAEAATASEADEHGFVFVNGRRVRMISTKGVTKPRKTKAAEGEATIASAISTEPKRLKSKLSKKELEHYRQVLLIKRAELVGDLSAMETEALLSGGGNLSSMPIHMADIGTDTYDQDFMLGLAESERERLHEIDDALQRIADGTYGICQRTEKPIPKVRLNAKPWAKYTIEAKRELEGGWGG